MPPQTNEKEQRELVSVIVPAYNGERVIEESIESVLSQTYTPIELIIIDDASKDGTYARIRKYENDDRAAIFKAVKHDENKGLAATLNDGIKKSQGKFIVILHQDCVLIGNDWIFKGLKYLLDDPRVAVVTGYYGIPPKKLTFTPKAFGVLRRQYHAANPKRMDEEVTFSEGKCDIYRREILEKIGGFPERFRIAGEDLYVSYKTRQLGYSIVKSYKLPVLQKFGLAADNVPKNLKKEFIFGEAMGGIFPMFRTFLFKKMSTSEYSRTRSLQRATQPLFVFCFIFLLLLAAAFHSLLILYLASAMLVARYLFYVITIRSELRRMTSVLHEDATSPFLEALVIAALGIVIDFVYALGFGYGLVSYLIGRYPDKLSARTMGGQ